MNANGYRRSHLHKGLDYHDTFVAFPYRASIWKLERQILLELVRERFSDRPPRYLDFACGTGRILTWVAPHCRSAVGVDVAASMLDVARGVDSSIELLEADITANDVLGDRVFDLITAFRFFPNAECELRRAALAVLASHLTEGGVLVFNNHKHAGSLRQRVISARRWVQGRTRSLHRSRTMSDEEARRLVAGAGLHIYQVRHLAVLPFSDHKNRTWLPTPAVTWIEHALSRVRMLQPLAQNLVYFCLRR